MQSPVTEPRIVVFFGLTGSGKSYLARHWSEVRGYHYLNSDEVRKALAGVEPESRHHVPFNKGLYSPEMTGRTYREMIDRALGKLRGGAAGVVLDGSYKSEDQRQAVVDVLGDQGTVFFIYCYCSESVTRRRFQLRAEDSGAVSDGRWEIYQGQKKSFSLPRRIGGARLYKLDTDDHLATLIEGVDTFIQGRDRG